MRATGDKEVLFRLTVLHTTFPEASKSCIGFPTTYNLLNFHLTHMSHIFFTYSISAPSSILRKSQ